MQPIGQELFLSIALDYQNGWAIILASFSNGAFGWHGNILPKLWMWGCAGDWNLMFAALRLLNSRFLGGKESEDVLVANNENVVESIHSGAGNE